MENARDCYYYVLTFLPQIIQNLHQTVESHLGHIFGLLCATVAALYMLLPTGAKPRNTKLFGVPVNKDKLGSPYRHPEHLKKLADTPPGNPNNVFELFSLSADKFAHNRCLGTRSIEKKEKEWSDTCKRDVEKVTLSTYKWQTYKQIKDRVMNFGAGLLNTEREDDKNVVIFMDTKADWMITALGCFAYGIPIVTVYATLGLEALRFGMKEAEIHHVITDAGLLKTMKQVLIDVPDIRYVIYSGDASDADLEGFPKHVTVISIEEIEADGAGKPTPPTHIPTKDDLAVIMYTSGSTGMPKGVMMSHGNILSFASGFYGSIDNLNETDRYIGYLPLAHILELAAETIILSCGGSIGYGSPLTLSDSSPKIKTGTKGDVTVLKPTLMACVPAIMDRIRKGVYSKLEKSPLLIQTIFNRAYDDKLAKFKLGIPTPIWDRFVFNKMRKMLGGNVRLMLSGGAPLSPETQYFMNVVFSCPVGQGYGLTETCGGGTLMDIENISAGHVGGPIACCELKLIDWEEGNYLNADKDDPKIGVSRGEVCIHGGVVAMGYFKNENETEKSFITDLEGKRWFHTGDIGQWNANGTLSIIDRKKDLVKLQHGEYVSLGKVEAILKLSRFVENVMVHANPMYTYCVALILPNEINLKALARELGLASDWKTICKNEEVLKTVFRDLKLMGGNGKLARFEQPSEIKIVTEDWTPNTGLVTEAMKLKRPSLKKFYEKDLLELYKSK